MAKLRIKRHYFMFKIIFIIQIVCATCCQMFALFEKPKFELKFSCGDILNFCCSFSKKTNFYFPSKKGRKKVLPFSHLWNDSLLYKLIGWHQIFGTE